MSNSPAFALYQAIEQHPLTVTPQTPVSEAIALMSQTRSICVLVVAFQQLADRTQNGSIVGISDRFRWKSICQSAMTQETFVLKESQAQNMGVLLNLFRSNSFRHLPIVNDGGTLVGLITHQQNGSEAPSF